MISSGSRSNLNESLSGFRLPGSFSMATFENPIIFSKVTPDCVRMWYENMSPDLLLWRMPEDQIMGMKCGVKEFCFPEEEMEEWRLFRYSEQGLLRISCLGVRFRGRDEPYTLFQESRVPTRLEPIFSCLRLWYPDRVCYVDERE